MTPGQEQMVYLNELCIIYPVVVWPVGVNQIVSVSEMILFLSRWLSF